MIPYQEYDRNFQSSYSWKLMLFQSAILYFILGIFFENKSI